MAVVKLVPDLCNFFQGFGIRTFPSLLEPLLQSTINVSVSNYVLSTIDLLDFTAGAARAVSSLVWADGSFDAACGWVLRLKITRLAMEEMPLSLWANVFLDFLLFVDCNWGTDCEVDPNGRGGDWRLLPDGLNSAAGRMAKDISSRRVSSARVVLARVVAVTDSFPESSELAGELNPKLCWRTRSPSSIGVIVLNRNWLCLGWGRSLRSSATCQKYKISVQKQKNSLQVTTKLIWVQ